MTAQRPLHAFDVIPGEPQPSLLALFFRRVLRMPWRKSAAPVLSPAGAAATTLLDTGEIAALHPRGEYPYPERPTVYPRRDGSIVVGEGNRIEVCPWPPAERPSCAAPPEPRRSADTRFDLPVARPYAPWPVYGEAPQDRVDEAQRLTEVMWP